MLVINAPVYATPFTVLATLALAFAAFKTIKQSSEQEQRRRKFEDAKENRDRNGLLLDEIINWTQEIDSATDKELKRGYFGLGDEKHPDSLDDTMMDNMMQRLDEDLVTLFEINKLLRQSIYIKTVSDGVDVELGMKVQKVMQLLNERDKLLKQRGKPELFSSKEEVAQKSLALECIQDENKPLDGLSTYWQVAVLLNRNLRNLMNSVDYVIKKAAEIKVQLLRTISSTPE